MFLPMMSIEIMIYEYTCNSCGKTFEQLSSVSQRDKQQCIYCTSSHLTRLMSAFYTQGLDHNVTLPITSNETKEN